MAYSAVERAYRFQSLDTLGMMAGVHPETIRKGFIRRGVKLRPPTRQSGQPGASPSTGTDHDASRNGVVLSLNFTDDMLKQALMSKRQIDMLRAIIEDISASIQRR
jgi:hypothetical protein